MRLMNTENLDPHIDVAITSVIDDFFFLTFASFSISGLSQVPEQEYSPPFRAPHSFRLTVARLFSQEPLHFWLASNLHPNFVLSVIVTRFVVVAADISTSSTTDLTLVHVPSVTRVSSVVRHPGILRQIESG